MVLDELMQKVMSLEVEERRQIFTALLHDPELKINPFDAMNLRQNAKIALALQDMMLKDKAERETANE